MKNTGKKEEGEEEKERKGGYAFSGSQRCMSTDKFPVFQVLRANSDYGHFTVFLN